MKRREFLRGTAAGMLGSAALALGACGAAAPEEGGATPGEAGEPAGASPPAQGQETVEWRMGTSWPVSLDTIYGGATDVAERVAAMTNGRFQINTFPGGELFPALEVIQNLQQGTVEAGHTASYYYVGLSPAFGFGTSVPFGLTAAQHNAWYYHGGGMDLMHDLYAQFNTIGFPAGNTGAQMGGWYREPIESLESLQGLKFRIPGLGAEVMQRLGVNTQTLPGGEIFQALQTGAIDAAEWVGPYDDQKLGLNDAAEFYYAPGWWEPGPALDAVVNLDAWNQLSTEFQEIFKSACYMANVNMLAKYNARNGQALQEMVNSGTQLRFYSDEIMSAAEQAAEEFYQEQAADDETFRGIYEPWSEFRTVVRRWNETNELPFMSFVAEDINTDQTES